MTQPTEDKLYYCAVWRCHRHQIIGFHTYRPYKLGPDPYPNALPHICYLCDKEKQPRAMSMSEEYVVDVNATRVQHPYHRLL